MKLRNGFASIVWLLVLSCPIAQAFAADGEQTYLVAYAKFKPGKAQEALKIIHEHFWPVDRKVGRKAIPFDMLTGEWDHVVYFPYDTAKMDTIPSSSEWFKALAEQEGGPEQAQRLFQSFLDLHASSRVEIAKSPGPLGAGAGR